MRPILTKLPPILSSIPPQAPSTPEQIHTAASEWTLRGITLLEQGDPESLATALACFEEAILLREALPLGDNPLYRWGLTAGWMNRGDALTRLGGQDHLTEALRCYDIAISHLHQLPLEADPAFRWRLGVAWINRGHTEQAGASQGSLQRALSCFENALRVMRGHETSPRLDYQQVMAAAWTNHAAALLQIQEQDVLALNSARRAIQHSQSCEHEPSLQETGIRARHALCRAIANLLESPSDKNADTAEAWIHEATDAVEDVMRLTQAAPSRHPLREEIFLFGCRIYRAFQPHFLAEFLDEGLASGTLSEAMKTSARASLTQAAAQIQNENLASLNPEKLDRLIQTLQALSETSQKLRA
ncbi:hypothetical protein SAMN02745166_01805 [Prosthecobacter debontii]|uniref:Tetratricopeptide repeat-containing protein n=1 Tax=Prosthecobacter debontii TaxID=48467 RepID=A0A1T4XQP8_9BACT|nr:hypothetical protein SAMN02745166_01805 [Prosthecobacter debontii]